MPTKPETESILSPAEREFPGLRSVTVNVAAGSVEVAADPYATSATLRVVEVSGPPVTVSWNGADLRVEQVKDEQGQVWGVVKAFVGSFSAPGSRPSARLVLTVPDEAGVTVRTVTADVTAAGSHGPVRVQTVSGAVRVSGTTGTLDVTTVSAAVDCGSPAGELKVRTGTGAIDVRDAVLRTAHLTTVSGRTCLALRHGPSLVTASSVTGATTITLPTGSGYDATLTTTGGHVVVDGEPLTTDGRPGGHRHVGDRTVTIKGRTVSGDLTLTTGTGTGTGAAPGPVIERPDHLPGDVQDEIRRPGTAG